MAVTAIITLPSVIVRKRLLCSITSRSRLLAAPEPMRDDLNILYQSQRLEDPYVITVEIANIGRTFIASEAFDGKRSLALGLTAPVVKVLTIEHEPPSAPRPVISANERTLELKPELIVKRESIKATLLTEGSVEKIEVTLKPFGDVSVNVRDREAWQKQRAFRRSILATASAVLVTAAVGLLALRTAANVRHSLAMSQQAETLFACSNMFPNLQGTTFGIYLARREVIVSKTRTGKVKAISFAGGYHSAVSALGYDIDRLEAAYILVKDVGLPLGSASSMPAKAAQVMRIFTGLPNEGTTKVIKDLATVSTTATLLSEGQSFPTGCP